MEQPDSRARAVIENVSPEIEGGRFPVKRVVGESVVVEADIFSDSHDVLSARLLYRKSGAGGWQETVMAPDLNDRWRGSFTVTEIGRHSYSIVAWVDRFKSWRRDLAKRVDAGQPDLSVEFLVGAQLLEEAASRASGADAATLTGWTRTLRSEDAGQDAKLDVALGQPLADLMNRYCDRRFAATYPRELSVWVDREKARFSTWYEVFPRSASPDPGRHGTFKDCEAMLPYIAGMGFDVLYLPPIHPIGRTNRKGRNNIPAAAPGDPGTPWAIGTAEGGHKAVHPELGTLDDFRALVSAAENLGIEIALDIAFQCSPDHPYVREHPEWFLHRPDGSIQYAENPPKKYQDIFPLNFECEDWRALWGELKSVFVFWIEQGVRIFRVDNPHTKPFPFWEWVINDIKGTHPEVMFLAEAFTRPKVMYRLAKLTFTQSYTYFAWRNTKWEIEQYLTELAAPDVRDHFRPVLWTNTPDILTEYLQTGGRPAFMIRLVLAATLGASYGIYGPAFELSENSPREPGSEEYLDSEKYQLRHWEIDRADSLKDLIARVNRIRRENPALQSDAGLRFHGVDNPRIICYSKHTNNLDNIVLVIVNLDPQHTHSGWVDLPVDLLGLEKERPYQAHDLLSGARYLWHGARNFVEINPGIVPAHIFRLRRRVRTEQDFDYYM